MPSNTTTLQNLIDRTRQRADMEGSTFVTDGEITTYINVGLAELHDVLVSRYEDYYVSTTSFSLPSGNPTTLPADFYKALGVDFDVGGTTYRMRRFSFQERNQFNSPAVVAGRVTNTYYQIRGDQIHFIPSPTVSGTVTLYYVPEALQFDAALPGGELARTVESRAQAAAFGYEEYLVLTAAIMCLQKEESDVRILLAQKQQAMKRIENAATNRDAGEPYAISDSSAGTFLNDYINWV